jgi:RHS repeat-associated protein
VISDQLGSPILAANVANAADVPFQATYDTFGTVTAVGTTQLDWMPFGFAGGMYDADTGLVRFGARDYDPEAGRWTSKDPIWWDGGQRNLYVHVGGDPVNHADSVGLGGVWDVVQCGGNSAQCLLTCINPITRPECGNCMASVAIACGPLLPDLPHNVYPEPCPPGYGGTNCDEPLNEFCNQGAPLVTWRRGSDGQLYPPLPPPPCVDYCWE